MSGLQKAVVKNMEVSLAVPTFQVSRNIVTDKLDALYAELKPKGVTVSALLAKACGLALKQVRASHAHAPHTQATTRRGCARKGGCAACVVRPRRCRASVRVCLRIATGAGRWVDPTREQRAQRVWLPRLTHAARSHRIASDLNSPDLTSPDLTSPHLS
jgi:hypothetical protein